MVDMAFATFATPIGPCAIAWGEGGIVAVQLSEGDDARTRARLIRRLPEAVEAEPPEPIAEVIDRIVALLSGLDADLGSARIDMSGVSPFARAVYEAARGIPRGRVRTYGAIAADLGQPNAAREVGQALGANPFALIVPCHRVVGAGGRLGGFSASGGRMTKRRIL